MVGSVNRKSALITGSSTGIGAACAEYLDALGFTVFASVRKATDADSLRERCSDRLRPVILDVTDEPSVRRAADSVSESLGGAGLDGLVNNAGVAVAGPLEFLPLDDLRRQLEVNVVGQVAVTQAFLPLLRRAKGRIVNMGSISGRVAIPFLGPYSASKFALEALTDALRAELRPLGVQVSVVEPGAIATPIWEKSSSAAMTMTGTLPKDAQSLYGTAFAAMAKVSKRLAGQAIPPARVARVVAHALTARRPRTRYLVGRDARIQAMIWALLPDRLADLVLASAMGLPQ